VHQTRNHAFGILCAVIIYRGLGNRLDYYSTVVSLGRIATIGLGLTLRIFISRDSI
jgi:hypothetical protein